MMKTRTAFTALGALTLAGGASPALADLPPPVRAMLDAAIASGNDADIAAVARTAKTLHPEDATQIDAIVSAHGLTKAEAVLEEKMQAGFLDGWRGSGELGGFITTGNTDSSGLSAGLTVTKEGIRLRHNVRVAVDYQRSGGVTTRDNWLARYEPNFQLSDGFYLYGLTMYEKDRFQGFADRVTVSGGFGYQLFATPKATLDVKGGPAWRTTNWIGEPDSSELQWLGGADLVWHLTPAIDFTNNAQALWGPENNTYSNTASFTAKISRALSARLSYGVRHETNPPTDAERTDTVTRATLVYGF